MPVWRNNSQIFGCRPKVIRRPESVDQLAQIVATAAPGVDIRAVGAGAASSQIASSSGILCQLDRLPDRLTVQQDVIDVGAHLSAWDFATQLSLHNLSLPGLRAPGQATLAGLIATDRGLPHSWVQVLQSVTVIGPDGTVHTWDIGDPRAVATLGGCGTTGIIIGLRVRAQAGQLLQIRRFNTSFEKGIAEFASWQQHHAEVFLWHIPGSGHVGVELIDIATTHRSSQLTTTEQECRQQLAATMNARSGFRRKLVLAAPVMTGKLNKNAEVYAPQAPELHLPWWYATMPRHRASVELRLLVPRTTTLPLLRTLHRSLPTVSQLPATPYRIGTCVDANGRELVEISANIDLPAPFERYFVGLVEIAKEFHAITSPDSYLPEGMKLPLTWPPPYLVAKLGQWDHAGVFRSRHVTHLLGTANS